MNAAYPCRHSNLGVIITITLPKAAYPAISGIKDLITASGLVSRFFVFLRLDAFHYAKVGQINNFFVPR